MQVLHEIGSPALTQLDEKTWSPFICFDPAFDPWSYDIDGDCYISLNEANAAVNDYVIGNITESQRDTVVALWKNGTRNPACVAPEFNPWDYDVDGDCYISMSEAQVAVNDFNYGKLNEAQRDEVVALWQNNTRNPACPPIEVPFPWQWLLIGGAAITGAILLIPKPKKAKEKIK